MSTEETLASSRHSSVAASQACQIRGDASEASKFRALGIISPPITHKLGLDPENIDVHQIALVMGKCRDAQLDKTREDMAEANVFETPPARKRTFAFDDI